MLGIIIILIILKPRHCVNSLPNALFPQNLQEVRRGDNPDTFNSTRGQEIVINSHQIVGFPEERVSQKIVVFTETMLQFLSQDGIDCRDNAVVLRALVLFEEKNIDFVHALLCARMLDETEPEIYSSDRDFDRVEGIRRVEPE